MAKDSLLLGLAFLTWLGLGYPLSRLLGARVKWPAACAPVFGLAILGVLITLFYARGLPLRSGFALCLGLAIPGLLLAARDGWRFRADRSLIGFAAALFLTALLVMLPKWSSITAFAMFQGNVADQFRFIWTAAVALNYDLVTLAALDPEQLTAAGFASPVQGSIWQRPAAALMMAGFTFVMRRPLLINSYVYLSALQLGILFASAFFARNVFALRPALAMFVAAGLTLGFFPQYVRDLNTWPHLASAPLLILFVGVLILGHSHRKDSLPVYEGLLRPAGLFLALFVSMAGIMFIDPEALPLVAAIAAAVVAVQLVRPQTRPWAVRRSALAGYAVLLAIVLCALAWQMTIGFLVFELRWLADPAYVRETADWWRGSQAYLFGYDNDIDTAFDFSLFLENSIFGFGYHVFSIVTAFTAGLLGVYFLQPGTSFDLGTALRVIAALALAAGLILVLAFLMRDRLRAGLKRLRPEYLRTPFGWSPQNDLNLLAGAILALLIVSGFAYFGSRELVLDIGIFWRIAWKLALLCGLTTLVISWLRVVFEQQDKSPKAMDVTAFAGVLGGATFVIALLLFGHLWAAGIAFMMLAPILFLALTGSLLATGGRAATLAVSAYVLAHLLFGAYRTYAAAASSDGVYYLSPPYIQDTFRKRVYRWDYFELRNSLTECSRVRINVDDAYAEMFAEMTVKDAGLPWASRRRDTGFDRDGAARRQEGADGTDCAISTDVTDPAGEPRLNWLRRDERVADFLWGRSDRLELAPVTPAELRSDGLAPAGDEGIVVADGAASIEVPNNPQYPARRLTLAGPRPRTNRLIIVMVNGRALVRDTISAREAWSRAVDLAEFATAVSLAIEVHSFDPGLRRHPQPRELALRTLALER
jgi:hypothetical protein